MEKTNNQENQKKAQKLSRPCKICEFGKGQDKKSYRTDYPSSDKIGSRSSTIARAMASTLMPRIGATEDERRNIVRLSLGKDDKNIEIPKNIKELNCVYCGQPATNLDHLFPFIEDKQPTGYFTESANLVPCCAECNQKKGAKRWFKYMASDNPLRSRLENYCKDLGLPTNEQEERNNSHRLIINDEIKGWWNRMYNTLINALDNTQIQIDSFKAGIKYFVSTSINSNEQEIQDNFFKHYFKELVKKEIKELFKSQETIIEAKKKVDRAKNALKRAQKAAKEQVSDEDIIEKNKKKIVEKERAFACSKNKLIKELQELSKTENSIKIELVLLNDDNNQLSDNTTQKYYTLLEHGFRLNDDWSDIVVPDEDDAQLLYNKARKAFILGFNYATCSKDYKILKDCIDKGWLEEVIVNIPKLK